MFLVAFPDASIRQELDLFELAVRAPYLAVWPAQLDHRILAILEIAEIDDRFLKCVRHHAIKVADWVLSVKYIGALVRFQ
jgi:hypothetical protein